MVDENVEIQPGGNGKTGNLPGPMAQFLNAGMLGGLTGQKEMPNAINMLVNPGKGSMDPQGMVDVLMRVVFPNRAVRIAAMHIVAQCVEFEDWNALQELFMNVVAMVSEGGLGPVSYTHLTLPTILLV